MKCECCGKELTGNTEGCNTSEVKIGGKTYSRIKYNKKYGDYCPQTNPYQIENNATYVADASYRSTMQSTQQ